ncbi:MAG: hypothetical protein EOP48_22170 [Sphingobacteriales bacterium]|nr:MAG: hypothetical protein EOP48_22170 [Sphingobacteriales bacterium]
MYKYIKPDQQYKDDYDQSTIRELKELEAKEDEEKENTISEWELLELRMKQGIKYNSFRNTGIRRARSKENSIRKQKQEDEVKDYLVRVHPAPNDVRCNTCNSLMHLGTHFFDDKDPRLLFVFDCPNNHRPKKIVYPNGKEFFFMA